MAADMASADDKGNPEWWAQKWDASTQPWKAAAVRPMVGNHVGPEAARLRAAGRAVRVLVPLCGDSEDMHALACLPGVDVVVGVEYAPAAVDKYVATEAAAGRPFAEAADLSDAQWRVLKRSDGKVVLVEGDFFTAADVVRRAAGGPLSISFDAASSVAMFPSQRRVYQEAMSEMLDGELGASIFIECMTRRQADGSEDLESGPPHALPPGALKDMYPESAGFSGHDDLLSTRDTHFAGAASDFHFENRCIALLAGGGKGGGE